MSFAAIESSRTLGQPIELYKFNRNGVIYAYTNADTDVVHDSINYLAVPITRNNIVASGSLDRLSLTVTIAEDTDLTNYLRARSGLTPPISLQLRQGHVSDPDSEFLVAWVGSVRSSKGARGKRAIECKPISSALQQNGLRRNWQYGCPNALYGPQCRASQPAATISALIVSALGNQVVLAAGWTSRPIPKYAGGLLAFNGEFRTIKRVTENGDGTTTLTTAGAVVLAPGAEVAVSLGCSHEMNDCRDLHVPLVEVVAGGGNIRNYGGMPFIPTTTPIGLVSKY